jgi:serine/threonine protein kinase
MVLQGRYQLERKLGEGGMSTVYLGRDLRFGGIERWVAIKEIVNTGHDSQTRRLNLDNFVREANILASLAHQGIPKVYDFFSLEDKSYLVMEYVTGQDLEDVWAKKRGPLPARDVVGWALQLCEVLTDLHSQKPPIVFRDIKPSNIMLTAQQRVMLIDFGIAKLMQTGPKGTMIGTEGYAPPEQYRGVAEPRTDIYALGATMHHLLSGRDPRLEAPFTFQDRPLREQNPDIPSALEEVVNKALAYDLEKRFANVRELSTALSRSLGSSRTLDVGRISQPDPLVPSTGANNGAASSTSTVERQRTNGAVPQPAAPEVKPLWRFQCEDELRSSPRILESLLYIGCYDHNLYALDITNGKFAWKFPSEGGISSSPLPTPKAVYIGSEDHSLYALHPANGQPLWRVTTRGPIRSTPRLVGDVLVFGSDDGALYAYREDQSFLWRFQAMASVRSSALIVAETAKFCSDDGMVYGIQMKDGRQRWKYHAGRFVISSPALEDRLVIFGSGDAAVHAIDSRSGWAIWRVRTEGPIISSPAVGDGRIYIGSSDGFVYALEARSGRILWKSALGGQVASTPSLSNEAVYVGSEDGTIHSLDRQTGKRRWEFHTGAMVTSSPLYHHGRVYVGSADHYVYALPA